MNEDRRIEYVNASAELLFMPVSLIGCTLPALFESCGAGNPDGLFAQVDAGLDPVIVRIGLADHRLVDGTLRPLSNGGFVLSLDDVTALVRATELAQRDPLTDLMDRASLLRGLAELLDAAKRTGQAVAVLYVDLDRFKAVNESVGHPVGDALLRKVADRFRSALREGDVVARLGGDQFAVIHANPLQPEATTGLARRLVDLLGRAYVVDGHILHVGASVGIAVFPADGRDADTLLKNADLALYRAKAEGRSCYRFFEPGMNERMQARRSMEIDLRRALAFQELRLEYQPQIDLETDSIVGFEALLRWRHPAHGLVSPADFIPLAEEIGVIVPIGEWVLRTACKQAAAWAMPANISVNLSPVQFRTGTLVETVMSALADAGLPASRLELELTEGCLIENGDIVLDALAELRMLGVHIVLDDFGTGYSSLSYLQKYPFDKVKIDRSFICNLDAQADRRAIVRAITSLASALGMKTTAEGVETEAELNCVRAEGCSEVQGYLTGRPLSAEAAAALLER